MADNFITNAGSGGDTFGADDVTSVKYPRVKLIHGADGTNAGDVATTNPLPISAASRTDAIFTLTTSLTPKFANVAVASIGANNLVTAVVGKKIRVLSACIIAAAANNVYFVDNAGTPVTLMGNATNKIALTTNSGFTLPFNPIGWFETTSGQRLELNLSAATAVAGCLTYVEV